MEKVKISVPAKSEGGKGEWELAPAGVQGAVLVDVIDLGEVEVDVYGKPGIKEKQRQLKFAFQLGEKMTSGAQFLLSTWGMKASLHDKAKMRKLLSALNGKDFEVGQEIDPEAFIGCNCLLDVIHKKSADGSKTYANIGNVMALPKGMPILSPSNYVRVQDRPKGDDPLNPDFGDSTKHADGSDVDADLPF